MHITYTVGVLAVGGLGTRPLMVPCQVANSHIRKGFTVRILV